jgi:hypothetical protein
MKSNLVTFARSPFRVRCFRRATTALLAGLTLMAGTTFVLHAQLTNIERAAIVSWPPPTEEQIVVAADSLTGSVWTPSLELIFKRFDLMCMTVPTTASQQFFKIVPGRQFADGFGDTWGPFTNRIPWWPYSNEPSDEWIVTNGVLRLNWHGPLAGAFALIWPPGSNTWVADFSASVHILDWTTSGTNWSTLGIMARGIINPDGGLAYAAGLRLNAYGIPGNIALWMGYGAVTTDGPTFQTAQFPLPYRLEYSGIGSNLTLRVVSLTTKELIREMSATYPSGNRTEGFMGLWINAPAVLESHSITVDDYFTTGTRP